MTQSHSWSTISTFPFNTLSSSSLTSRRKSRSRQLLPELRSLRPLSEMAALLEPCLFSAKPLASGAGVRSLVSLYSI